MRYLGIDYGRKRVGIAVSDPDGKIAFPTEVIQNRGEDYVFKELQKLIEREKIERLVVGLPMPFSGETNEQYAETKKFGEKLARVINLPTDFENELLTTKSAEAGSIGEKLDASAAAIILQSHLDKINKSY